VLVSLQILKFMKLALSSDLEFSTSKMVEFKMPRAHSILLLVVLLGVIVPASAKTQRHGKPRKAPVKTAVPEPAPALPTETPAPPPTPEQGPSSPPDVSFQSGQLVIVARNSTMADVLAAVKQKTGAAVEMPAASNERVVGRFGPGAPRDVMAQLLNGSHYDYVLLGSPADPGSLRKVVLMARANGPETVSPRPTNPAPMINQNLAAVPDVSPEEEQDNGAEMPPEIQQEEPQPEQPGQQNPSVKTPEQLLRELQQQQQQQQDQNAPPPAPPQ
jgi:hypothetical protein